jgi:hypothetical protein
VRGERGSEVRETERQKETRDTHRGIILIISIASSLAMVFTYIGKFKEASCILRPWFGGLGFAIAFTYAMREKERETRDRESERV